MEIHAGCVEAVAIDSFKIDLIVWKYNMAVADAGVFKSFKIDLIVWK